MMPFTASSRWELGGEQKRVESCLCRPQILPQVENGHLSWSSEGSRVLSGMLTSWPLPEQEKFLEISRLHFRTVPSNPHYYFYCPPSSRREVRNPSSLLHSQPRASQNPFESWFPGNWMSCFDHLSAPLPPQDEGPRDTVDRKISDLEFSEAELVGEEGV